MRHFLALMMIILSIIQALFIYNGIQENIDTWPELNLPDFFSYASFICIGLIILIAMFMKNRD
ncbi:hypothetical protein [Natribacillus halophilus]|uniref:Uncharacterized protein n=1 Tax=Natribacillus halophilus TaxID=549003 RepID=A0A1G8NMQ2_9BACI|nr:hypothetical protein [Natribacillus halophilus]SDI81417.1 hypothetical protein SAMN04488123_106155 [Natribacillus halophilus]